MNVKLDIIFETYRALPQQAGMDLWTLGEYFSEKGTATYRLKSTGTAESLADALEGLTARVQVVVEKYHADWPPVLVTQMRAERVE